MTPEFEEFMKRFECCMNEIERLFSETEAAADAKPITGMSTDDLRIKNTVEDVRPLGFPDVVTRLTKCGGLVAFREGWNGKNMCIWYTPGHVVEARDWTGPRCAVKGDRKVTVVGHFDMKAADGNIVIGWLASQTDVVTQDWRVISADAFERLCG